MSATAAEPIRLDVPTADPAAIGQCWDALVVPGDVHEVRIPKTRRGPLRLFRTVSGYFDDRDAFVRAVSPISGADAQAVYLTLNPVNPALLARAANRLEHDARTTTSDADVVRLKHLLIDTDPVRPADISATDEQRDEALKVRDVVRHYLRDELGWPHPAVSTMSGNGGGLLYPIDLPNDADAVALLQRVLHGVNALFGTDRVTVDTTTYNPARITKIVGTIAAKGDHLPDFPWRRATGRFNPQPQIVSLELLEAVAAVSPKPEPRPAPHGCAIGGRSWDVKDLLRQNGIGFTEKALTYATALSLDRCLTSQDHTEGACILAFPSGAVSYTCRHNRCAGKRWEDVRSALGLPTGAEWPTGKRDQSTSGTAATEHRTPAPPAHATARPRLRFVTARAFAAETPAQTEWVVKPFVPVGAVTKIDGPPKRAGKTTLIVHMIKAVLDGQPFMGEPTRQGPVVMLSEQGGTSLRAALNGAGLLDRDDLHLALYRDIAPLSWIDVVADTFGLAVAIGAVLVVCDTFPAVSGVRGDDENSSGRALAALEPVQVEADLRRIGVISSFHDRKSGGEVGESGRGSSAYSGAVDVILQLSRPGGNIKPTVRKISTASRFSETPEELFVELTSQGYVALGSAGDVVRAMVGATLASVLATTQDAAKAMGQTKGKNADGEQVVEPGILDDLAAQGVKAARSTVDAELDRWIKAGYVGRSGEGKRGSPYAYWLVSSPPDAFFRLYRSGASEERNAAGQPVSSNGGCASEESNDRDDDAIASSEVGHPTETPPGGPEEALLSSDGWDLYSGRKHPDADEADGDDFVGAAVGGDDELIEELF